MKRSVSVEMELGPGTYVVRMKVSATRIYSNPTIDHMLKYHVHNRQEKLIQVAMSYDLAHAKGLTVDTEEQKQRDAEEQGMEAATAAAAKTRVVIDPIDFKYKQRLNAEKKVEQKEKEDARRRIHQMLKVEQKVRNELEDNLIEGQGLRSGARLNKPKHNRRNRHRNKFHNGTQGFQGGYFDLEEDISYSNFKGTQTTQDRINVVNHSQAFQPQRPVYKRPIYQNHMRVMSQNHDRAPEHLVPTLSSLLSETAYTFNNSPRNDRDQDGETWTNDSDCDASDPDPNPGYRATDPWNAVCVVGLRVYTKNGEATIKIIQDEDKLVVSDENGTTSNATPDVNGDQKLPLPTPLDYDDPNKGLSDDITSSTKVNGTPTTAQPPVQHQHHPVLAEQLSEQDLSQQGSGQGSPRTRGGGRRRFRGPNRGQNRGQSQNQGQSRGQGRGRGQPRG